MAKTVSLTLPLTRADLADLQVGDEVLLSGPVYTMPMVVIKTARGPWKLCPNFDCPGKEEEEKAKAEKKSGRSKGGRKAASKK